MLQTAVTHVFIKFLLVLHFYFFCWGPVEVGAWFIETFVAMPVFIVLCSADAQA